MKRYLSHLHTTYLWRRALQELEYLTIIQPEDRHIYNDFFGASETYDACYANGWGYITQAARGIGLGLGIKYLTNDSLITVGCWRGHFVVINPLGIYETKFEQLLEDLSAISEKPVFIKKLTNEFARTQFTNQLDLKPADAFYPWHKSAPEDDDTFPEVILDVNETLAFENTPNRALKRLRSDVHTFLNIEKSLKRELRLEPYTSDQHEEVWDGIAKHFGRDGERNDRIFAEAYINMLVYPPPGPNGRQYASFVARLGRQSVGFLFAETLDDKSAALYAAVGSAARARQGKRAGFSLYPGLSEYLHILILEQLRAMGVRYVNLGGSEVQGLHTFKRKFAPKREVKIPILVYGLPRIENVAAESSCK